MNTAAIVSLRDLVGPWSRVVLVVGLSVVAVILVVSRKQSSSQGLDVASTALGWVAAGMITLAGYVFLVALPASSAYSGPIPSDTRHLADYDKYFATGISLLFAVVFTSERFRLRRRAS